MDTGEGLNRGDITEEGRESDGDGDLEVVGGGRGIDGERGVGQLVVSSVSVGVGAEVGVWGDKGDISGGRGGTGGGGVGGGAKGASGAGDGRVGRRLNILSEAIGSPNTINTKRGR